MPRTLTIFFPDGTTEYWLTTLDFTPGDKIERNGRTWTVTSIGGSKGDGQGRHMTVTVSAADDGTPRDG